MRTYLSDARETVKHSNNIRFENLHRFFPNLPRVVTFCAYNRVFKPGSGQFDIIYDLTDKTNQTIKPKFEYLENLPVRVMKTSQFSLGFKFDSGNKNEYEECVTIIELKKTKRQICPAPSEKTKKLNEVKAFEEEKKGKEVLTFQQKFKKAFLAKYDPAKLPDEDLKDKVIYTLKAYVVSRGKKKNVRNKKNPAGTNNFYHKVELEFY